MAENKFYLWDKANKKKILPTVTHKLSGNTIMLPEGVKIQVNNG